MAMPARDEEWRSSSSRSAGGKMAQSLTSKSSLRLTLKRLELRRP